MARYAYDRGSFSFTSHKMQRLQTLQQMPVVAGESLQMDCGIVVRLAPLTRGLALDAKIDIATFFVPMRHVYSNWEDFIQEGADETQTLAAVTIGGSVSHEPHYLGVKATYGTMLPLWAVAGYAKIWNRYYKHIASADKPEDNLIYSDSAAPNNNTKDELRYGLQVTFLPDLISMTATDNVDAADYQQAIVSDKLDIRALMQQKARLKTELRRSYIARRYSEQMQATWGTEIGPETDERPHIIMHTSEWLSGTDVYGTADANLAEIGGLSQGIIRHGFPRRLFPEHGVLWTMGTVRFPVIREQQVHYLHTQPNPSYKQLAGDPDIIAAEPPHSLNRNECFIEPTAGRPSVDLGKTPYGQWYRMHPSYVHDSYDNINGFPFISSLPSNQDDARYGSWTEWDDVFKSQSLGHAQMHAHINVMSSSPIPPSSSSIFVGAKG